MGPRCRLAAILAADVVSCSRLMDADWAAHRPECSSHEAAFKRSSLLLQSPDAIPIAVRRLSRESRNALKKDLAWPIAGGDHERGTEGRFGVGPGTDTIRCETL